MLRKITLLALLMGFFSVKPFAQCSTTNYGTSQVISTNTTWPAGTYNISGDFTINAGVILTVTYSGNCPLNINATNINILGEINASGAGATGGAGGAGGGSSGGAGGGNEAGGGKGGSAGAGIGGGSAGNNGAAATAGCSIDCGTVCFGGNDADRAGAGGGAGGAGGSFGAQGGKGGAGAQGRLENEPTNSDCGSTPVPGSGGSANTAPVGYSNTATNTDLPTGSGGGGGGGGGGGFTNGTAGGTGGNGGGAVNLVATGALVVSGSILANGGAGDVGGNGGVRSGNAANWNCETCPNTDGTGANDCRDNSECGACSYYTWSWPGGAGGGAGGGSGGGIKLEATGAMTITGVLQANGGAGGNAGHGNTADGSCNNYASGGAGGAGGVIKYVYDPCANNTFTPSQIQAEAGAPGLGTDGNISTNTADSGVIFNQNANIYVPGFTPFTTLTAYPNQVLCGLGHTPNTIATYAVTGGGGTYDYQWYYSTITGTGQTGASPTPAAGWSAFTGATASTLPGATIGPLNMTTYYQLQITSGPCITWSNVVRVLVDSIPSISHISVSNVLCNGGNTGSITVTATGGDPGYSYSSNGGTLYVSNNVLSGLSQGSYNVYVNDTNNCSSPYASNPVVVNQPAALTFTDTVVEPNCAGLANGSITVYPSGGITPYQYAVNAGNNQTNHAFTGLAAGNYLVLVTDANACPDTATIVLSNRYVLSLSVDSQTTTSCFGVNDATLTLGANGGITPYTYSLNDTTFQPSNIFTGLAGGYYVAYVNDSAGCANHVDVEIINAAQMEVQIEAQVNIPCNNSSLGAVYVAPLGGTPAYTYSWTTGDTTQNETSLRLGTYTVTITDVHNCTATATADITFDPSPTSTVTSTNVTGCFGNANGSASVTATGGTLPYVYQWSDGETTNAISNVTGGVYIFTVSDINYCTSIDTIVITQPAQIMANLDTVAPLCATSNDGMAGVSPSGGTPGYVVAWSTISSADTITNLAGGNYTVTITDANSCSAVSSFTLSQPAAINGAIAGVNDSCFGNTTGSAALTATGGTLPYSYLWSTGDTTSGISNLPVGKYVVTLSDAHGCTFADSTTITQPAQITFSTSSTNAVNGDNGTAGVSNIAGGVAPYIVQWSNGQGTNTISNLAGGTYIVIVTDQNGCSLSDTLTVNQNVGISVVPGDIAFSIYPNPANNAFTVEVAQLDAETTLSIKNVLGETVLTKTITALKTKIDLNDFAGGVYMVELTQGGTKAAKQVVVTK